MEPSAFKQPANPCGSKCGRQFQAHILTGCENSRPHFQPLQHRTGEGRTTLSRRTFCPIDRLAGYGSKSILTDNENTIAEARICRILGLTVWLHYADAVCFYCCEPVRLVLLEDIPYGSEEGMA